MSRSLIDGTRFMFVSDIPTRGNRVSVAIHWTAHKFKASTASLSVLSEFLAARVEVSEVWFVCPFDVKDSLIDLHDLDDYSKRTSPLAGICFRFFTVGENGRWAEADELRSSSFDEPVEIDESIVDGAFADGMRQLFRDTDSLVSASAGFHFERPGRGHSEYFIRTSAAVARAQHAYFIAATLLKVVSPTADMKLFADTGGILPLLSALKDLIQRSNPSITGIGVDSFGGYDGVSQNLQVARDRDYVIISSSTSGSLAQKLIEERRAQNERTLTVFYLSTDPPPKGSGIVICDLTNRDSTVMVSVRDARRLAYPSYRVTTDQVCDLCRAGSHPIELAGDDFFPAPSELELRMPVLKDRTYSGPAPRTGDRVREFDGSDYFTDFFGTGAITVNASAGVPGRGGKPVYRHGVSTRLGDLLTSGVCMFPDIADRIELQLDLLVSDRRDVSAVVSLPDDDSRHLAEFAARQTFDSTPIEVAPDLWRAIGPRGFVSLEDELDSLPAPSTILICAGVIASGRALLNLSRTLRRLPDDIQTVYLVGIAHPESGNAREIFENSLGVRSGGTRSRFRIGWELPREPGAPGAANAWIRERRTLGEVEALLEKLSEFDAERQAVIFRLEQLSDLNAESLFASPLLTVLSPIAVPGVNPKFALWPFEWSTHPRAVELGAKPTSAEIFATVAHLLYESRRSSSKVDSRPTVVRRHGYALNPAVFDRFNEPQLQSSILRSAEPGELDYHSSFGPSRAAAEIVRHVVENYTEYGGAAAYEFLLSLADGLRDSRGPGLRLMPEDLSTLLESFGRAAAFSAQPPLLRAVLIYLGKMI